MWEIVASGGWLMVPILACSAAVLGIVIERIWSLNPARVMPERLLMQVWGALKRGEVDRDFLLRMRLGSPLGDILSACLANRGQGRRVMKDAAEEAGNKVAHDLQNFLTTLNIIAVITPLLGLLGTVTGMITVFTEISEHGTGNAGSLAGGISQALITTAAGLSVAIPATIALRFFERRVDSMVVHMEQQAARLIDAVDGGKIIREKSS